MAVPAHDSRDYDFALKYDAPISWVIMPDGKSVDFGKAFIGEGIIVNSSNTLVGLDINGLSSKEAALTVIEWAEKSGKGKRKVHILNESNWTNLFNVTKFFLYGLYYIK